MLNSNIGVVFGNGDGTFGTVSGGGLTTVVDQATMSGITYYPATTQLDSYMSTDASLIAADMTGDGQLDLVGLTVQRDYPYTRRRGILRGSATVASLLPNTVYCFAAFAQSTAGITHSTVLRFTTAPAPRAGSLVVTTLADESNTSSDPALGTAYSPV